jgi:hypothetical protein
LTRRYFFLYIRRTLEAKLALHQTAGFGAGRLFELGAG